MIDSSINYFCLTDFNNEAFMVKNRDQKILSVKLAANRNTSCEKSGFVSCIT